jgi:hypothetical protein
MEGAGTKKFAPVKEALQPGVPLRWTEAAGGRPKTSGAAGALITHSCI